MISSIDLIILGYLFRGEKSAYEMVKEFETWDLTHWIKISNASIYKKIIKLCENGYLNSKTIKEGEMPEKIVYSINTKGNEYFHKLMDESSTNFSNVYFDFSGFIANLNNLSADERHNLLKKFNNTLKAKNEYMNGAPKEEHKDLRSQNSTAEDIIGLYEDLYKLLDKWSSKLLEKY
ncbi:MAG: PadR family transcriptional regulator [Clostridium sp.]|uniref:PadR family transcriptional regulator n=1 Tax=Clostridium sp. TaxID=1506 RepID=UPI0039ECF716